MKRRPAVRYSMFDTGFGTCGVAWSDRGLRWLQLPSIDERSTEQLLRSSVPEALAASPPEWVNDATDQVRQHLAGTNDDLQRVPVDLTGVSPFFTKVYERLRDVLPGATISYGELARDCGSPGASRAVGQAMAKNPVPVVIPCHRVLAGGGQPGGFSAPGSLDTKSRLLALEGVELSRG